MTGRTLIAGVGNVFCGDDGFGVAVAHRLAREKLPAEVDLRDYGIRGGHLAYQILTGYETLVLVDALHRDGPPGTLYVVEAAGHEESAWALHTGAETAAGSSANGPTGAAPAAREATGEGHDWSVDGVLALVPALGGQVDRVVVVGCEPADIGAGIGLSPAVENAVGPAAKLVLEIVEKGRRTWTTR
ncbi:hydrogenase maturation protease [Actinopolymorpha pittospori]|uniref:Hydrogenase maturation protease n=1 Tax=Actinopolymorpha pittospori TaxID=648752 RepID=A0A927N4K7_9ACTN|nr:hydrogenase maturation protease [Actinopolymorpha pittospori]MBE1608847.1 hydrogenase maturation protease [Actinopolymorpha pittospori]